VLLAPETVPETEADDLERLLESLDPFLCKAPPLCVLVRVINHVESGTITVRHLVSLILKVPAEQFHVELAALLAVCRGAQPDAAVPDIIRMSYSSVIMSAAARAAALNPVSVEEGVSP
jgi:hypothetical protein